VFVNLGGKARKAASVFMRPQPLWLRGSAKGVAPLVSLKQLSISAQIADNSRLLKEARYLARVFSSNPSGDLWKRSDAYSPRSRLWPSRKSRSALMWGKRKYTFLVRVIGRRRITLKCHANWSQASREVKSASDSAMMN